MVRRWLRVTAVSVVVGVVGVLVWVNRAELPAAGRALAAAWGVWLLVGTLVLVLWWTVWLLLYLACRRLTGVG
ncbi:MAG: lysylphosphatidylglycerol synthase transmembrane domain-containing protein, partial [Pseudonocardiaceae bacterium]